MNVTLPNAGEKIVVTVDNTRSNMKHGPLAHLVPDTVDLVGVMNDNIRVDEDMFSIIVPNTPVPVRVIHFKNVIAINGKKIKKNIKLKAAKTFQIDGSKGATYTVNFNGSKWSCNCPAGSRGRGCRHIVEAQNK